MSLIIPVGIPGCGKSTWANHLLDSVDVGIHSSDDIRVELAEGVYCYSKDRNDDVFEIFHQRIRNDLAAGLTVYADATNLQAYARAKLVDIANFAHVSAHVVVFTNIEQAITRNLERERVVPEDVMTRFLDKYEKAMVEIPLESYRSRTYISGVY